MCNTKTLVLIFIASMLAVQVDASGVKAFKRQLNYGHSYTNAMLYSYYFRARAEAQSTFWAEDGGYSGMVGEDGTSPRSSYDYDEQYENTPQVMYDMATGERRVASPSGNGPQHNWNYMQENDPNSDTPWKSLTSAPKKLGKKAKKLFK